METLADRIARDGPVTELDAIGWAIRLAKRLEVLHALGVAHGSVSPACMIAAGPDRNARAYLADLQHTTTSPPYQSPERLLGGDISPADDVWALAATLYALLTGQSPFSGATDAEIRQKILAAAPAPLAVFDVGDDDLQHILDHAFARDIASRTAGAAAFRRALEEWHPDRGVANLPPLEDEDSTNEDDDGARTMIAHEAAPFLQEAGLLPQAPRPQDPPALAPRPAPAAPRPAPAAPRPGPAAPRPGPAAPRPAPAAPRHAPAAPAPGFYDGLSAAQAPASVPKVSQDEDDDDEENVRTVMREMPAGELQSLIARADARLARPQPGAAAPAPAPPTAPAAVAPRPFPGPSTPLPQVTDDATDDDDDVRTIMRTPEQIAAESAGAAGPSSQDPWRGRDPAGEPGDDLLPGAHGTQKIPQGFVAGMFAHADGAAPNAPAGGFPDPGAPQPPPGYPAPGHDGGMFGAVPQPLAQPPGGTEPFSVMAAAPQPLAPAPWPAPAAPALAQAGTSKKALVLAAFIALIVAAAATFALLRLRGI